LLLGALLSSVALGACSPAPEAEPDPLAPCAALGGEPPRTIGDAVARIDALPEASLVCFVASLPRPLQLVATSSPFSLQPADGASSPRIFILGDGLFMSVVPTGPGSELLELGEQVELGEATKPRTVKGELHFPLTQPVSPSAPYDEVREEYGTRCGVCHRQEVPHPTLPGAFVSEPYRPREDTLIAFSDLRAMRAACDERDVDAGAAEEDDPCPLLCALFDYGPVQPGLFSSEISTFF
jgi:hypothetical protein